MTRFLASLALAFVIALPSVGRAAELPLPVVIKRGPVVVKAQKGMERDARRLAEKAPKKLKEIASDLPELPTPRSVEIRLVRRSADLPRAGGQGRLRQRPGKTG